MCEQPCYGFRLNPRSVAPAGNPSLGILISEAISLRNIFGQKCHELYGTLFTLVTVSLALSGALFAQQPPLPNAQVPQVGAAPIPNAAAPDQRVKILRAGAPGPNEYQVNAETEETDGDLRHLRGHVHMESEDKKIDADAVDYNDDTGDVEAWGNVRYENFLDGTKLNCDHAKYNVNTETGVFYDVRGTSESKVVARPGLLTTANPFYFEGKWGERQEGGKYIIHDGFVTDCKVPKPWWRLTASKFDILQNDRAITYRAVFRLKNIPIFYFPVYYKSLKVLPRQSGFLTPNIGHSSIYGEMFGLGYYWAISRSYDLLYRIQYFTSRGPAHNLELRGKIRPGTDFSLNVYAVEDRGVNIGNILNAEGKVVPDIQKQGGEEFTFDGHSDLGDGWTARVHLDELSSFLFRLAFSQSFHDTIFSETHSTGFVIKHWSTYVFDIVAERDEEYENDLSPDNRIIIKHLPEAEFGSHDRQILGGVLPVWFSLTSSAGMLDRIEPEFETPRFVSRLDVYPEVTTAFHFDNFSLTASGSIRETDYSNSFLNGEVTDRGFLRSAREIDVHLIPPAFEKIFNSPKWLGGDKVKHVIEPRIDYKYVDGISDFSNIIRFDDIDLMNDTNQVTFSLTNRLFVKDKNGNVEEVMSWEVAQSRYFDPTFGGAVIPGQRNVIQSTEDIDGFDFLYGPRSYSPVVSILRFQHLIGFEWRVDYDPLLGRISNSSFQGNIRLSKYFFGVGHTEVNENPNSQIMVTAPNNQINILAAVGNQNRKGWNVGVNAFYDLNRHVLDFATTEITYNTDCCGITAEWRRYNFGVRDDTQYRLSISIANIGSFGNLRKQERIY
jgi:LPS-assembly protein